MQLSSERLTAEMQSSGDDQHDFDLALSRRRKFNSPHVGHTGSGTLVFVNFIGRIPGFYLELDTTFVSPEKKSPRDDLS